MNKMTEITAGAPTWTVIKPAWDYPVISWIHWLRSHLFPLLVLDLEVCNHLFDQSNGLIVTHLWLLSILLLPLGDNRENLISLTCKKIGLENVL
jgi:hypothetical protein